MNAARLGLPYTFLIALPLVACSSTNSATTGGPRTTGTPDASTPIVDSGNPSSQVDSSSPGSDDAGAGSDDAGDDADAGPVCNTLPTTATMVDYALSNDSPTAATGGTIADGTYTLTAYTIYGAGQVDQGFTAGQATSITLVVQGANWMQVQIDDIDDTTSTTRSNYTVATTGSAITLTPSCPEGAPLSGTFNATGTALQFISQDSGFVISETFAQQ